MFYFVVTQLLNAVNDYMYEQIQFGLPVVHFLDNAQHSDAKIAVKNALEIVFLVKKSHIVVYYTYLYIYINLQS